jgi:DNA-directed RNA polymerase delta subunit
MSETKTWTDIVYDILKEKNKPMHYQDITKEAVKRKKLKEKHQKTRLLLYCYIK